MLHHIPSSDTSDRCEHEVRCPGSSARHNGQSASFTALNGLSQQLLIRAALTDAHAGLGTLMEAHGTGTALGDPIEVSSITAIAAASCRIFAIKGNMGHTESTAGVANVMEVTNLLWWTETAVNVQLLSLNPQVNQVRGKTLEMPADVHPKSG